MNEAPSREPPDPSAVDEGEAARAQQDSDDSIDALGDEDVATLDQAAIARSLLKSAPSEANIYLIFSSGMNANIINKAGVANFGVAPPAMNRQTISAWFTALVGNADYDGASIAAVAFLPMSPVRKQRQAAKALAAKLELGPAPLATTFADSLNRIEARVETITSPFTGQEIEGARLEPPERAEVRQHLWTEVLRFEEVLSPWICQQGASGDLDVSMPIGLALGDLTLKIADAPRRAELRRIFDEVIDVWAANGGARHALGQALRIAASNQRVAGSLAERLRRWTRPRSTPPELRMALNVCRSSWAVKSPELALDALRKIEPRARSEKLFFGLQSAISTLWLGASLLRNEQQGLATVVARTLTEWSPPDETSAFFKTPQQRIAYAIDQELERLTNELPLVLASALGDGELARIVGHLFSKGRHHEGTRRDIEATLSKLMARAKALDQDHAYKAFVDIMQEMGFVVGPELGGLAPSTLSRLLRRIMDWLRNLLRR